MLFVISYLTTSHVILVYYSGITCCVFPGKCINYTIDMLAEWQFLPYRTHFAAEQHEKGRVSAMEGRAQRPFRKPIWSTAGSSVTDVPFLTDYTFLAYILIYFLSFNCKNVRNTVFRINNQISWQNRWNVSFQFSFDPYVTRAKCNCWN